MTLAKKILTHIQRLPESSQAEVLDFVEFIEAKIKRSNNGDEWTNISISNAMRGMENDPSLYSLDDIKEKNS